MKFKASALAIVVLAFAGPLFAESVSPSASTSGYKLLRSIPLPGDKGWDLLAIDSQAARLYTSHGDQVLAVDLTGNTLVGQMGPFGGTHGVALAPDFNRGYVSDGKADQVACFDLKTLSFTARIATGKKPDVVILDPLTSRIWAFNADGDSATVIQVGDNAVLATVGLGGAPEFAVADGKGHVFVNLEDKSQLLKIDSKKMKIVSRWDIAPGSEASSLSFDSKNHRLFLGCHNHLALAVNSDNGKVVAQWPIGDHVDGSAFDAERGLVFHSCGDGTLNVVHEDSPDHYSVLENVATQKGARTIALDPKTHLLYLPSAEFGDAPAATPANQHPWPAMVPGSFHLLVVGKEANVAP